MKAAGVIVCAVLALACGYIFVEHFEYPGVTWGKVVFGTLAVCFLVSGVAIAAKKKGCG